MITRNLPAFAGLFLTSVPAWWLFELINHRTRNWVYVGGEMLTNTQYVIFSSISFSTVMPAVFGTAELVRTFRWINRMNRCPRLDPRPFTLVGLFATGWLMLGLLLVWPSYFFPCMWLSIYFILEPVNNWLGHRSLLQYTSTGDWRPIIALWVGCLVCGFFWEMWNFYSYPKWVYRIPFFDYLHIFEMPLLGYGGYLPFSLELFALYHLMVGFLHRPSLKRAIQISSGG